MAIQEGNTPEAPRMLAAAMPEHAAAAHSRFVQRVRRRYGAELAQLAEGLPLAQQQQALVATLMQAGRSLPVALRVARQMVLERLAVLDLEHGAGLGNVTAVMSQWAETALQLALTAAEAEADTRFGPPLSDSGQRAQMWIVGMGKLGARELNVSSDIDLVYVYEEDGHTSGGTHAATSAHEYFSFVAKRLQALVGDTLDDGFVFRMDLALRPNGLSGPPVVSLAMLEEYFQVQGREWERFAWLKSRVVAPRAAVASGRALALRSLVTPFVYRRYLDYGVFEGLRQLHQRIRSEATRRAAGRPERSNDVKLSRGGIREIEFIVQLLQVVRGGQYPEIRTRQTLLALQRLAARGLMPEATAQRLSDCYVLLRRIEHRIQYLDDQQTHQLPTGDADLHWLAHSLGHGGPSPACALLAELGEAREFVAAEFDTLLREGQRPGNCRSCTATQAPVDDPDFIARLPEALAARLKSASLAPKLAALREDSRLRLARLLARTAAAHEQGLCTTEAMVRFVDWVEPLLRRENYLALLAERPEVLERLLRLLGLARWPAQYMMRHPGLIDELASTSVLAGRFDGTAFAAELQERREGWRRSGEDSEERLLDTLRHAHHAELMRTLVRDVEGHLSVEQVADDLSALADQTLQTALGWCWSLLRQRHRDVPQLALIAYGKLGGKELGYGSDLDVVFVYDDSDEPDVDRAQEIYAALVRKLITWLTVRTAAGELFDIDTALRPNGNSGLLVTSIAAYERYQRGRGSNTAWTWEHQAITRARFCAGAEPLAARVLAVRREVLMAPRQLAELRAEVHTMRERVRAARPVPAGRFDVKHSHGGMMDVEFCVQTLVLAHAHAHPELLDNAGNIALLQRAEAAGLLPAGVGHDAANAYRELRRAQHRARLDEQTPQFPPEDFEPASQAVKRLWNAMFN
jgi:[glutamine synthetase] adenylyltransferase / [glutamine synthetase]-adenylyl-L-tyrosine phosphorylase